MGLTVLDAGILIGFLDADDAHHEPARKELGSARDRNDHIAIPASALAESLVSPSRQGVEAVDRIQAFLRRLPIDVVPLDETIATTAANLRARHGAKLKLPDALVVATAHVLAADVLLTTDRGWPDPSLLGLDSALIVL